MSPLPVVPVVDSPPFPLLVVRPDLLPFWLPFKLSSSNQHAVRVMVQDTGIELVLSRTLGAVVDALRESIVFHHFLDQNAHCRE